MELQTMVPPVPTVHGAPAIKVGRHEQGTSPKRCCESHSGQCGQGPRVCSQTELRSVLRKEKTEDQKKRDTTHPLTGSRIMMDQEHCVTINYVLCSSNFEDIVIIHPINIDECDTNVNNDNYTSPTKNEICNAYFKQLK